jgi:proteic killer suppression protein
MIVSFGDRATEDVFHGRSTSRALRIPSEVARAAAMKMDFLDSAGSLQDLRLPPGNRLEALKGDLRGLHAVRVNDQWRLVFRWEGTNAHQVRLVDYH